MELGAAPGSWTQVLVRHGLHVVGEAPTRDEQLDMLGSIALASHDLDLERETLEKLLDGEEPLEQVLDGPPAVLAPAALVRGADPPEKEAPDGVRDAPLVEDVAVHVLAALLAHDLIERLRDLAAREREGT